MKIMWRIPWCVMIGALMIVPLALGQCRAEAPVWNIGLYWSYSYQPPEVPITPYDFITYSVEYLVLGLAPGEKPYYILFNFCNTAQGPIPSLPGYVTVESHHFFMPEFDLRLFSPIAFDFPLEVGKQWIAKPGYNAEPIIAKVVALERINTDSGAFDAFHIRYWQNGMIVSDLWYAPAVKSLVKQISPKGGLTLKETWQFSAEATFHTMFQILEEVAKSRPDLALGVLSRLIELGIAQEQASAMIDALLNPLH